jgi:hypothetical protein
MPRGAAPFLLALLLPTAGLAQERIGLRTGNHPGFGRVVLDATSRTTYRVEQEDGRVVLRLAAPAAFEMGAPSRMPRNLRGIETAEDSVTLTVAPGVRLRHFRLGTRIVLDLMDAERSAAAGAATPAPPRSPAPVARARPTTPPPPPSAAPAAPAVVEQREPPAPPPPAPAPAIQEVAEVPVVAPAPPPAAPRAMPVRTVAGGLVIPAGREVGAALLRRGGAWLLVLDAPLTLDLAPLRDGPFAGIELTTGPLATALRIPAAVLAEPWLTRGPGGWRLENREAAPTLRSIRAEADPASPDRLLLRAGAAASVTVLDPETGGTLLIGTLREGGEAVPIGQRGPTLDFLPTRLGAAILPRADTVTLRALKTGFVMTPGPGTSFAPGPDPAAEAAGMSRLFDLPALPLAALVQRERTAMQEVAAAPPLARAAPRLRNAEALLALGLAPEAQAMVALAMREDAEAAQDPRAQALHAAAALVAGRVAEMDGLLDPQLPESDELMLWRGLLAAARGEDGAPERIAAAVPLLHAWPEPLRARLAPLAAETLAGGGEPAAARRLLAGRQDDSAFALAHARLLEAEGEAASALEAYEAIARGRDRRARAVAMRRIVELRLASGALDAAGAAAEMESVLAVWRGDGLESAARIRMAELRQAAGDPRGAFDALRETERLFPALCPDLRPRLTEAQLAAIEHDQPIAAVALFDTHAALLPPGEKTEQALAALADRLAGLDLMDRARRVLGQALARATDAESRARLGLRLARMALEAGDAPGARAALADTATEDITPALQSARKLVEARALLRLGETEAAVARYREAGTEAAPELAELLAARQDWAGAAAVLRAHLVAALPPPPEPLPEGSRRLVARTAALLTLAGDEAGLAGLREAEGARMADGAFEIPFTLLTAARLAGPGDLPRLRRELELARALPSRLKTLRAEGGNTR